MAIHCSYTVSTPADRSVESSTSSTGALEEMVSLGNVEQGGEVETDHCVGNWSGHRRTCQTQARSLYTIVVSQSTTSLNVMWDASHANLYMRLYSTQIYLPVVVSR
ncbi:hypothetical protein QCA50_010883 [Cerrena zonata]|uniref:Uncharacterized protein n=1 Tax=Cerrena zonata TaxID=2478898 RepID=A0AAW0G8Z5_9APHY